MFCYTKNTKYPKNIKHPKIINFFLLVIFIFPQTATLVQASDFNPPPSSIHSIPLPYLEEHETLSNRLFELRIHLEWLKEALDGDSDFARLIKIREGVKHLIKNNDDPKTLEQLFGILQAIGNAHIAFMPRWIPGRIHKLKEDFAELKEDIQQLIEQTYEDGLAGHWEDVLKEIEKLEESLEECEQKIFS